MKHAIELDAIFEDGVFKLSRKLPLREGAILTLDIPPLPRKYSKRKRSKAAIPHIFAYAKEEDFLGKYRSKNKRKK